MAYLYGNADSRARVPTAKLSPVKPLHKSLRSAGLARAEDNLVVESVAQEGTFDRETRLSSIPSRHRLCLKPVTSHVWL